MSDSPFVAELRRVGVVAVIRAASADAAVELAQALVAGGVTGIEITYSTPDCARAITRCRALLPAACVGVGTVLTVDQLAAAVDAGARFAVSPHTDEHLLADAARRGIPFLPGAITPTEIVRAHQLGAAVVKLFPGSIGGPDYLKAVRAPLPHIPIMPTGGVGEDNLAAWLAAGAVAVGMGGRLVAGTPAQVEAAARAVRAKLEAARASR